MYGTAWKEDRSSSLTLQAIRAMLDYNQVTLPQLVFRFAQQVGMLPLRGTTNALHMSEDLACGQFDVSESDICCLLKGD